MKETKTVHNNRNPEQVNTFAIQNSSKIKHFSQKKKEPLLFFKTGMGKRTHTKTHTEERRLTTANRSETARWRILGGISEFLMESRNQFFLRGDSIYNHTYL